MRYFTVMIFLLTLQTVLGQAKQTASSKKPRYILYECIGKKIDAVSRKKMAELVARATSEHALEQSLKEWAAQYQIDDAQATIQELPWPKEQFIWIQSSRLGKSLLKVAGSRGGSSLPLAMLGCLFSDTLVVVDSLQLISRVDTSEQFTLRAGKVQYNLKASDPTAVNLPGAVKAGLEEGRYIDAVVTYQPASGPPTEWNVSLYFFTDDQRQAFSGLLQNWFSSGPADCDKVFKYSSLFLQTTKGGKRCEENDLYLMALTKSIQGRIGHLALPCRP